MAWIKTAALRIALVLWGALSSSASGMSYLPVLDWPRSDTVRDDARGGSAPKGDADRVVVKKSERRLYLMRGEDVLQSYPIALGFQPIGHKRRQGDGRTPEGRYRLDRRNDRSRFHRALHISYPNRADAIRAARRADSPGGLIMIHGQPAGASPTRPDHEDWTEGCIAVSNAEIEEIWARTRDGILIEILP